jgi:multicomponent K+:H+ antiporter subunit G
VSAAADLPLPAAVLVAFCLLGGGLLVLAGAIGLVRLGSFYQRVHAPTLGTTLGMFLILVSSILYFSITRQRLVLHEILIAIFLTLTTPISLMLVVRAALYRDRQEGDPDVPAVASDLLDD